MAFAAGANRPWTSFVMSWPKIVTTSQTPKPTSADVAARRMTTDSSSPNDSQRATYRKVTRTQATSRTTSEPAGHDAQAEHAEARR